jgi:hypothetical protein
MSGDTRLRENDSCADEESVRGPMGLPALLRSRTGYGMTSVNHGFEDLLSY